MFIIERSEWEGERKTDGGAEGARTRRGKKRESGGESAFTYEL